LTGSLSAERFADRYGSHSRHPFGRHERIHDSDLRSYYRDRHRNGRTPFAGNLIPASRQDPTALLIQKLFPSPNQSGIANNYYATGDYSVNRYKFDGKVIGTSPET